MQQKTSHLLFGLLSIGVSIGLSFLILFSLIPRLPLSPLHPINQVFGIRKAHVIGFFPYWLLSKADKNYDPYLTNMTYFGLVLNTDGTIQKKVTPNEEEPGWTKLRSDDFKNRLAQTTKARWENSLLVHSSSEASISALLKDPQKHAQNLITDVEPIFKEFQFSDLNLDIESFREASDEAQLAYTQFVSEVKKQMSDKKLGTVSVEVTPFSLVKKNLTQPAEVGKIADRIVLMAYDYHYRDSYNAGPVAPVDGTPEVRGYDVETSVQEALKSIPAEKLILGVPSYGYEYETIGREAGAAVIPGSGKTASNQRVEEELAKCVHCEKLVDPVSQQPVLILPATETGYTQQMYYEDQESLQKKIELANKYHLQGIAIWAMGYEGEKFLTPLREYRRSFEWK
jgi:spore germination protein YaaH